MSAPLAPALPPASIPADGANPLATRRVARGRRVLGALATLLWMPGAGHVLLGRARRGWLWFGVCLLAVPAAALSAWGFALFGLRLASVIDLFLLRVSPQSIPTDRRVVIGLLLMTALGFSATRVARAYVAEAYTIPAGSMMPTLDIGDHIMVNKLATPAVGDVVVFTQPCEGKTFVKRMVATGGDRLSVRCGVLYVNHSPVRTSAEPVLETLSDDGMLGRHFEAELVGESLGGTEYRVARDAGRAPSSFPHGSDDLPGCPGDLPADARIEERVPAPGEDCPARWDYVVPDGYAFMLGDSRDNSNDSRVWGPVPLDNLLGRTEYVWWTSEGGLANRTDGL